MRKLMRITFAPCGEEWIVYKCSIRKLCNGGMREEKSKYKWKIKKVDNNSTDQTVQRREIWKAKRVGVHFNPQFRSIIPCEVLLYIEVTFLGFIHWYEALWCFLDLSKHKIPHPNQWGSMITTKKYCLFNEDLSVVGFICI